MAQRKVNEEYINKAIEEDPSIKLLNKHWQKFFGKFYEINDIKVSQWQEVHVLAHISNRFKETFGKKFSITVKGAPSKSPDIYLIRQIIATVGTTNMKTIKQYIDWVFDKKIIPNRVRIRKLSYFLTTGFANEFLFSKSEDEIIRRTTTLPKAYKEIADALGIPASTYGDLAFIKMARDRAGANDVNNPYFQLFANLEAVGFEFNILERLAE